MNENKYLDRKNKEQRGRVTYLKFLAIKTVEAQRNTKAWEIASND